MWPVWTWLWGCVLSLPLGLTGLLSWEITEITSDRAFETDIWTSISLASLIPFSLFHLFAGMSVLPTWMCAVIIQNARTRNKASCS